MISTQAAPDALAGTLVAFDRHSRTRFDGRAGAAPAVGVLVADGQALVRAGFRALLEAGGEISVVGEASTGEEAVALARRLRPDVVLIDATLPGLDCVEATARILADPGVAVMVLTATELDERIFATLRAGACGLVVKDTDPAELVRAIELLARGDALLSPTLTPSADRRARLRPRPSAAELRTARRADPPRTRGRRPRRAGAQQRRHRRAARHQPRHVQDARQPRDAQARRPRPRPTRRVRLPCRAGRPPCRSGGPPGAGAGTAS